MSSAASGSLGALLMIAPLAAIPVFAIVGMPRFTSMVAANGEEEPEVYDLGPASEEETPASRKIRSRGADDLFAPFDSDSCSRRSGRGGNGRSISARESTSSLGTEEADDEEPVSPRPNPRGAGSRPAQFEPGLVHPEPTLEQELATPRAGRIGRGRASEKSPRDRRFAGEGLGRGAGEDAARWLAAKQRIQELGISWHQLSPEEDREGRLMFVFTCFVTAPGEPSHRYAASGATPILAIEATLNRVEELRRVDP